MRHKEISSFVKSSFFAQVFELIKKVASLQTNDATFERRFFPENSLISFLCNESQPMLLGFEPGSFLPHSVMRNKFDIDEGQHSTVVSIHASGQSCPGFESWLHSFFRCVK